MSTVDLRASRATHTSSVFGGVARIVSALRMTFEALDEAISEADKARRRYPFTAW
jgi:hypothetical protein